MSSLVHQTGAQAGGDVVGRDKIEHYHQAPSVPVGIVEQLLKKLHQEIENNQHAKNTIDALAYFQTRRSSDGVNGLEAKLHAGNRSDEYFEALEKKELFAKLLERWSLYSSAQEIFAYLLARADYEFNYFIYPQIETLTRLEVNEQVGIRIISPTIFEIGSDVFTLNHSTVMGMLYWLAEQCFVRWHK